MHLSHSVCIEVIATRTVPLHRFGEISCPQLALSWHLSQRGSTGTVVICSPVAQKESLVFKEEGFADSAF